MDENYGNMTEDSIFEELLEIHNIRNFECSKIPWLTSLPKLEGKTTNVINLKTQTQLFLLIVDASVPRYLSRKYHAINASELMKDSGAEWNYATLQTMFVMHNEAFGIKLMRKINDEITECNKLIKLDKVKEKREELTTSSYLSLFLVTLLISYGGPGIKPILESDLCTKAREFLLEPCILIQLPWKPAVFQQWLLGALAEVLLIERESLELRHWYIHNILFECATQLLSLVRDLKSRIVLGFAIMGRMVNTYPECDPTFHQYVLEDVVLPSVPVLNFLISGKARQLVKNVKKKCCNRSPESTDVLVVPKVCYTMDKNLEEFHAVNFCSFFAYTESPFNVIFPNPNFNIHHMVQKLKYRNVHEKFEKHTYPLKPLSVEELKLLKVFERNQQNPTTRLSRSEKIDCTIDIIDENIIKKAIVGKLTINEVKKVFKKPKIVKLSDEVSNLKNTSEPVVLIRHSLLCQEAFNCRAVVSGKGPSALRTVLALQLQTLEREQRVRLMDVITDMFEDSTISVKTYRPTTIFSIDEILEQISQVHTQIQNQTSDSIYRQLPTAWKKPVNKDEPVFIFKVRRNNTPSNSTSLAESLEQRIGRLVYNISKTNFEVVAKGGYPFPHFNLVQHLLPCFVTFIFEREHRKKRSFFDCQENVCPFFDAEHNEQITQLRKIIKLAHNMIKHYEECFIKWSTECKPKINIPIKNVIETEENNVMNYYRQFSLINLKYREFIRHILLAHVDDPFHSYTLMLHGFDQIINHIPSWPLGTSHKMIPRMERVTSFMICMEAWLQFGYNFFVDFMKICQATFEHPTVGHKFVKHPKLSQLHDANIILCELQSIFEIAIVDKERDNDSVDECQRVINLLEVQNVHMKIHKAVTDVDLECLDLDMTVKKGTKTLLAVYNALKSFRRVSGSILKFPLYEKLPHSDHPIVKKAVSYYMNGNLDALDKMLTVFKIPYVKKCRHCNKTTGQLTACVKCVEQKFPDVNYYCSKKCREARWKAEHMEEHLDFELGLSDCQQLKQ